MSEPTLKIAAAGYDITTADPKNLTIDSTRNHFKVAYSGKETFSLNSGNGYSYVKTITHNFGYKPQVLCWGYSILDSGGGTPGVNAKFSMLPFNDYVLRSPTNRLFIASIERSTTYAKFKFYESDRVITGAVPQPAPYTLTNMEMSYIVFIDKE